MAKKKFKSKALRVIIGLLIRYAVALLYELALASLLPLLGLMFTPEFQLDSSFAQALALAIFFIISGFLILLLYKKRIDKALISLGMMTLFPGVLALLISFYQKDAFIRWAGSFYGFEKVQPLVESYLQSALPKVNIVVLIYILVGTFLIAWGMHYQQIYSEPSAE